ncbi:uncharacterized protein LOC118222483 [Anguilla anguilla]|uniref:uncharacterized protein LOC118222483 n=1 Tax=Anguilla anguilla TaxID=7936 RepID=UPI0015A8FF2D|nr:uncharacterized protein LOC118222483 [Anguilla anguilla]
MSSSYLYSLSFTAQRTNRVSGRGESPEEESSDTVMPPLCAVLVLFSKVYGLLGKNVDQPYALVGAQLGDNVTLPCFHAQDGVSCASWFKQPLGQKPRLIALTMNPKSGAIFFNDFKDNERFSAKAAKGSFNLTVSQVEPSDSATYYCTITLFEEISFGDGATLMVTGSESLSRTVVLQQPESESVQSGDSVTLQCTVHTETCAGEHGVYWFRQGTGESPPGIIYTHGNRSDECQRSSGAVSPTQSCVYNFSKRNLSPSDAGTYYCAVATCGEILFGNGTKLDFERNEALPLYCLVGALALSVVLNIVLALKRRKSCENYKGAASNNQESGEDLASKQSQEEAMNYAALTFNTKKPKVRRNKREVERETVYSDMRFRDRESIAVVWKFSTMDSVARTRRNFNILLPAETWTAPESDGLLGSIIQPDAPVRARIGGTVTLPCFYTAQEELDISWFKKPLGLKPQLIVILLYYQSDPDFLDEFKNSARFSAEAAKGSFNLTVSQVEPSDSATYYCAITVIRELSFGNGTALMVTNSESPGRTVILQQPESESVQPGDSVTLQCTVHTETCAGEHSVYWFRQGSGESPPGIIYTHGTRNDECQGSSGAVSPTQSCVYNFPKRNLSLSDAGTYYCAVATCGEILFGNGTKLDFEGVVSFFAWLSILRTGVLVFAVPIFFVVCREQAEYRTAAAFVLTQGTAASG